MQIPGFKIVKQANDNIHQVNPNNPNAFLVPKNMGDDQTSWAIPVQKVTKLDDGKYNIKLPTGAATFEVMA